MVACTCLNQPYTGRFDPGPRMPWRVTAVYSEGEHSQAAQRTAERRDLLHAARGAVLIEMTARRLVIPPHWMPRSSRSRPQIRPTRVSRACAVRSTRDVAKAHHLSGPGSASHQPRQLQQFWLDLDDVLIARRLTSPASTNAFVIMSDEVATSADHDRHRRR